MSINPRQFHDCGRQTTRWVAACAIVLVAIGTALAQPGQPVHLFPRLELSAVQQSEIARIVRQGIARGNMAGCVVAVGDQHGIRFQEAFGNRQVEPTTRPMTIDTVFDLASLTKPIATASAIMKLAEAGKLKLDDPAARHWPEFGKQGKDRVTIRQLLHHRGGLIPDNHLRDYEAGPATALDNICQLKLVAEPGEKFIYTDVGFIVLAEIVRRVSGRRVDEFVRSELYQPLGMNETMFVPGDVLRERAAATEKVDGEWLLGRVHDPRAARLQGVAGHAGLFSTAGDLSRYARMLLGRGSLEGASVLLPDTVQQMSTGTQFNDGSQRGLGWDVQSGYSSNRGDLFSRSAFGHGGFTGTSFWVDPELDLFVIFLSNRLHPDGKGSVNSLAGRIGTIAAASRLQSPGPGAGTRKPLGVGIDNLQQSGFRRLRGLRTGLITNQTGVNRDGTRTATLFHDSEHVNLVALFSPEHGIDGKLDVREILDSEDAATGVRVYSLYGKNRQPTAASLQEIDVLVFDIQDIGTRFYTYISTMGLAMEAAERAGVSFVVLDRPNPINGVDVQGPGIDPGTESFTAFHDIPVRHGMTVGELALLFKQERELHDLELTVIPVEGWSRTDFFDRTGCRWVNPSPNMRSLTQALLYPGIGLLETTNLSVGRGTDTPFEVIGAPWIDERQLAAGLNSQRLPGVRFVPIRFAPTSSKFRDTECGGVNIVITDRQQFHPLETGIRIARYLYRHYPQDWRSESFNGLLKNRSAFNRILSMESADQELRSILDASQFHARRKKYLLYK